MVINRLEGVPLFGRRSLSVTAAVVTIPHGHRDGIVQNKSPYQAEDELQFAVDDVTRICIEKNKTSKFRNVARHRSQSI